MDKLRAIEYFVRTVEAGSMSAAARLLEVSPPAITKQLAALEAELGTTLLRRDSRRLMLTPDGDRYLKTCTHLLGELRETESMLDSARAKPQGRLVVGASRTVLEHCVVPRLAEFCERHADLEIEFRTINYVSEPTASLCQVLVTNGWQEDADWIAHQVARGRHAVVASPAFWRRHGMPQGPADLRRWPCLAYRVPRGVVFDRWQFSRGHETCTVSLKPTLVFDDRDSLVEAAVRGQGMHFGNDVTLRPWLRDGRLQLALADWAGHGAPPVHVMYRRGAKDSAAVRAFADFAAKVFADLQRERDAEGPADTSGTPDWFRSRYAGRLTERRT
jgi:LysR family transcriptional regulator for bpeEF and oprC